MRTGHALLLLAIAMTDPRWRNDLNDVDIDPNEALDTGTDRNRDPGADLDAEGVPADDRTSELGQVPDPEVPAAPTDEPVGSTAYGTTELEQATGESLDTKLAREEPDQLDTSTEDRTSPAEEAAIHVERVPPTAPDLPPLPDEVKPGDEPALPDAARPDQPEEPHERPSADELPSSDVPSEER